MARQRSGQVGTTAIVALALVACGPASSSYQTADPQQLYLAFVHAVAPRAAEEAGDAFLIGLGEELCSFDAEAEGTQQRAVEAVYAEMGSFDVAQAELVQAVTTGAFTQLCPDPAASFPDGASFGSGNPLPTGSLPPLGSAAETVRTALVSSVRTALEGAASGSEPIVERITQVELIEGELAAEFRLARPYEGQAADIAYAFTAATARAADFVALRDADPLIRALVWHAPTYQLRVIVRDGDRTFEAATDAETLEALAAGTLTQDAWLSRTDAGYTS